VIGGLSGMFASGVATAVTKTSQQPGESSDLALGSVGMFGIAAAVGLGLYLDGNERQLGAVGQFNRDAERSGCR
jgi:hypothetical protein